MERLELEPTFYGGALRTDARRDVVGSLSIIFTGQMGLKAALDVFTKVDTDITKSPEVHSVKAVAFVLEPLAPGAPSCFQGRKFFNFEVFFKFFNSEFCAALLITISESGYAYCATCLVYLLSSFFEFQYLIYTRYLKSCGLVDRVRNNSCGGR